MFGFAGIEDASAAPDEPENSGELRKKNAA
jgi:hypothetical protein